MENSYYQKPPGALKGNVPILVLLLVLAAAVGVGVVILSKEQQKTDDLITNLQQQQVRALTVVEDFRQYSPEQEVVSGEGVLSLKPIPGWDVFFPQNKTDRFNGLSRKLVANLLGQPPIVVRTLEPARPATVETWAYVPYENGNTAIHVYFVNGRAVGGELKTHSNIIDVGSGYAEFKR